MNKIGNRLQESSNQLKGPSARAYEQQQKFKSKNEQSDLIKSALSVVNNSLPMKVK
jgi:hypothetical protein